MTDRELLELAAKAAGFKKYYAHYLGRESFVTYDVRLYNEGTEEWGTAETTRAWNPLTDDGDALQLVVKLDLSSLITWHYPEGTKSREVWSPNSGYDSGKATERYGDDPYAATRRAIVRAAAELGRIGK